MVDFCNPGVLGTAAQVRPGTTLLLLVAVVLVPSGRGGEGSSAAPRAGWEACPDGHHGGIVAAPASLRPMQLPPAASPCSSPCPRRPPHPTPHPPGLQLSVAGVTAARVNQFRKQYEAPILRGREPDATPERCALGEERSAELSAIANTFIMRRTNKLLSEHLPPKARHGHACRGGGLRCSRGGVQRHTAHLIEKAGRERGGWGVGVQGKGTHAMPAPAAGQRPCHVLPAKHKGALPVEGRLPAWGAPTTSLNGPGGQPRRPYGGGGVAGGVEGGGMGDEPGL